MTTTVQKGDTILVSNRQLNGETVPRRVRCLVIGRTKKETSHITGKSWIEVPIRDPKGREWFWACYPICLINEPQSEPGRSTLWP